MIYLDGRMVPPEEARIDPCDRGLLLGDGLFETLRAYDGAVPWLDRHIARLRSGAETLRIPLPAVDWASATAALLAANQLDRAAAALRITLTRGIGRRGLLPPADPAPRLLMTTVPLPPLSTDPARAQLAAIRRNEQSPLSRHKSLSYLDNVLARMEAEEAGHDEAVLLNSQGRVASASAANIFAVEGARIVTPPVFEGALPGITRQLVLERAGDLGLEAAERPLAVSDLYGADEVFLTNSLIELRPLGAVDGRPIGPGGSSPTWRQLRDHYRMLVADEPH